MNATPPAKKTEKAPPDNVEKGYAKKAEAARGKKKMSQKLTAVGAIGGAISTEVQKVIIARRLGVSRTRERAAPTPSTASAD